MRRMVRLTLITSGLVLLLVGLMPMAAPVTMAQEPPPRPSVPPATATSTATEEPSEPPRSTTTPQGRITGTVIDLNGGAPVPGVAVRVGDDVVVSDANGNYDRNGLAPGSYIVELLPNAAQGVPAQGRVVVDLAAGATVVQHLALRSPLPAATAAPSPTAPTAPPPTATAVSAPPARLPRTAAPSSPLPLLALGLALVGLGSVLRARGGR